MDRQTDSVRGIFDISAERSKMLRVSVYREGMLVLVCVWGGGGCVCVCVCVGVCLYYSVIIGCSPVWSHGDGLLVAGLFFTDYPPS